MPTIKTMMVEKLLEDGTFIEQLAKEIEDSVLEDMTLLVEDNLADYVAEALKYRFSDMKDFDADGFSISKEVQEYFQDNITVDFTG